MRPAAEPSAEAGAGRRPVPEVRPFALWRRGRRWQEPLVALAHGSPDFAAPGVPRRDLPSSVRHLEPRVPFDVVVPGLVRSTLIVQFVFHAGGLHDHPWCAGHAAGVGDLLPRGKDLAESSCVARDPLVVIGPHKPGVMRSIHRRLFPDRTAARQCAPIPRRMTAVPAQRAIRPLVVVLLDEGRGQDWTLRHDCECAGARSVV